MAKNYILEPTEVTFEEETGATLERDNLDGVYESITDGSIIEFSGTKLKYAGVVNNAKGFTPDGTMLQSEPENWASIIFQDGVFDNPDTLNIYYKYAGTFTVSIYTETEDETPDEDPGAGLIKNIIHNDHPYNDVESFLDKQGGPKTGYNTVEKISNATISGGGDSGSSANAGYSVKKTEDVRVTGFSTSEVYSENNKTGFEIPIGYLNVDRDDSPTEYVIEGDYEYKWSDESNSKQRHFKGTINAANRTYSESTDSFFVTPGELIAINADDNGDIIVMRPAAGENKVFGVTLSPISLSNVTVTAVYYDISVTEEFFKAVEFVVNSLQ